jgi:uncharacterized membrane protein YraQ (UPF0718 family)
LDNAFTLFVSLLVEAMPFLLLGVLLSSALALGIDEGKLIKSLPRHPFWGALVGSSVGFLFPVCECGNVPVARRLLLQGMPSSVALGFLLAAPTINPVVIWSTWVAFRDQPAIVVGRVVFSLAIAVFLATLFSLEKNPQAWLQPTLAKRLEFLKRPTAPASLLSSGTFILGEQQPLETRLTLSQPPQKSWRVFLDNVSQEIRELGGMLIIGSAIAASIQAFVPREIILNIGQDPLTSILAMLLLAVVVSICSTVDAFFALSFVGSFTSSSLLAFLVLGPMVDLKGMGLMLSIFKPRIILYLFAMATQLTFLLTLAHSYLF